MSTTHETTTAERKRTVTAADPETVVELVEEYVRGEVAETEIYEDNNGAPIVNARLDTNTTGVGEILLEALAAEGWRLTAACERENGDTGVDFVPIDRDAYGNDELPPRAAHTVEEFEGAVIGMDIKGRCRNCGFGTGLADPIEEGENVALYVVEREPERTDDDPRPSGYHIMSLWHRGCAPVVGTRTETEYVLGGELRRDYNGEEVAEYLDDVELLQYSPDNDGVDLLAGDDEPPRGHDTRRLNETATDGGANVETRETEPRSTESKPSNPRVRAPQPDEDAGFVEVLAGEVETFEYDGVRLERAETDAPIYHAAVDDEHTVTLNMAAFSSVAELRREVEDLGDETVEGDERFTPGAATATPYGGETREGDANIHMSVEYRCSNSLFMSFLDRELRVNAEEFAADLERYREIEKAEVEHTTGSSG
mgnify:CR=1 FL=1